MIQIKEVPETPATRREEDGKVAKMAALFAKIDVQGEDPRCVNKLVSDLLAKVDELKERNATLEKIVTQRASRNATRQKAYRDRKRGQ